MVDTQNKLSIVKQCRLLNRGGLYYKSKTGKFRELENNAITRPTVF
jgi:putative transposase